MAALPCLNLGFCGDENPGACDRRERTQFGPGSYTVLPQQFQLQNKMVGTTQQHDSDQTQALPQLQPGRLTCRQCLVAAELHS